MYIHIHSMTESCTDICKYVFVSENACAYACVSVCECVWVRAHVCTHVSVCMCVCVIVLTQARVCVCARARAYACMRVYVYVCVCVHVCDKHLPMWACALVCAYVRLCMLCTCNLCMTCVWPAGFTT